MRPNPRQDDEQPIDWLAEFDSEPEPGLEGESDPSYAAADLSMFPSEAVGQLQQAEPPLFHVQPAGPPTGSQQRYGDYLGDPPSDPLDVLVAGMDRVANRVPEYRDAMVAQLRRRRAVIAATAAILVISTAATAGSLAMRRWQHPADKTVEQRRADTDGASAAAGVGLFGGSLAAPVAPVATKPAPPPTRPAPPKPTPPATTARPPKPTPTPAALSARPLIGDAAASKRTQPAPTPTPDRVAVVTSNPPPAAGNRAVTLPASPAATPTPSPTLTPAPATTPSPTPTPTPAPTMSPEAADTAAIQGVLARYRRTFDSLSVDDVAAFWPSVNVRSLGRAFDQLASQRLTFEGCTIDLRGVQADATCRGRVQFVPKVGSKTPRVENRQWTFLLLRSGAGWTITRVDVR
jgi:hypothetical protein